MKLSMGSSSAWWLSPPKNGHLHYKEPLLSSARSPSFLHSLWDLGIDKGTQLENLERCVPLYSVSSLGPPGWGGNENIELLNASPARKRPPQNCWTQLPALWGQV